MEFDNHVSLGTISATLSIINGQNLFKLIDKDELFKIETI